MSGIYLARNQLKEKTYEESMSEELKLFKDEVMAIVEDLKVSEDIAASLALQKCFECPCDDQGSSEVCRADAHDAWR